MEQQDAKAVRRSLCGVSEEQQGGQDIWSREAKEGVIIAKIRDVE